VPALVLALAAPAATQQRLTIIAPAAPGGGWDQTARTMQQALQRSGLSRGVRVLNVAGNLKMKRQRKDPKITEKVDIPSPTTYNNIYNSVKLQCLKEQLLHDENLRHINAMTDFI
jgi:tripartite-type tricarboxylate transporter receptor subunit TctC